MVKHPKLNRHPRIMAALQTEPWLCSEDGMRKMLALASYEGDPAALKFHAENRHEDSYEMTVRDNVAILPISGPIFPKSNLMTDISGATALSQLALDFQSALNDETVDTILLNIDSPGGAVSGIHEMATAIKASNKKVVSYVGASAASAAYWIAAASDEIIMDATAQIGSIGVVAGVSKPDADGDSLEFTNTASPRKRMDIMSDAGKKDLVERLDALADVFIADVAEYRNVSVKTVTNDFGQGGLLVGQSAVDAGMADRLGSYESLLQELIGSDNPRIGGITMDLSALTKEQLVAGRQDLVHALTEPVKQEAQKTAEGVEATHSQEVSALTDEVTALKAENAEQKDALSTFEKKDAVRNEQDMAAQAQGIVANALTASTIPERLHAKVSANLNKDAFVAEGSLDVDAFTAHVTADVKDWEDSLGDTTNPIQGLGGNGRVDGSSDDTTEDDDIVTRMLG